MSDLISRQAVIDAFYQHPNVNWTTLDVMEKINEAPPTQPEHGRWIPCEERMPEEPYGCLVTVMDTEPMTGEDFENLYPCFVGWDGEQWNDCDGCQCPFEVLAWMPLPEPYMMDGENDEAD